ncbi:MAG: hypothetical protein KatS3mg087_1244 [Patescibacteria group bacterium]|nr:MAG: hypothetical protein KatS3mg087_1244 [Patescibacteria group bacterium]
MFTILARASAAVILSITVAVSSTTTQNSRIEYPAASPAVLSTEANPSSTQPEASPSVQPISENELRKLALQEYLGSYSSPMSNNAADFIDTANIHGLDWKLLPSIAGVESTFGRHVPANSYNPFGWANGAKKFQSWKEAISTVGEGIERIYTSRGRTTPALMQPVYAPPSQTWATKVEYFMQKLEQQYQTTSQTEK